MAAHLRARRSLGRAAIVFATVAGAFALTIGAAFAYWAATGTGSGTATTGTLKPPTAVTVPASSSGSVAVRWTASTSAFSPITYYVTRTSGSTTSPACGTSASSGVTTTSCTDSAVPNGTYTYSVVAVFRSWTATSAPSGAVQVASANHLAFTTQPTTGRSGASFSVAVAVLDPSNAAVAVGGTSISLSIGNNPSSGTLSGTTTATTNSSGVATFSGLSINKSGNGYSLNATGAGVTAATSGTFDVTAAKFVLAASSPQTAGAPFAVSVTAANADGTTATNYSGDKSVTFSGASTIGSNIPTVTNKSGTPTAFGAATTMSFSAGIATVSGSSNGVVKLYKNETANLSVSDGAISTATATPVVVNSAAPSTMAFVNCSPGGATCPGQPIAIGNNNSLTANIDLFDQFGNLAKPSVAVTIGLSSNDAQFTVTSSVTVATTATRSGTLTVAHGVNGGPATITAHVTAGPALPDITLGVKK